MKGKFSGKCFILDTCVPVHDPYAIHKFGERNKVIFHIVSIEELDGCKKYRDERGLNAREVSRQLLALNDQKKLGGPKNFHEHRVSILYGEDQFDLLPPGFERNNDNRILVLAKQLEAEGYHVVFISQDANALIKAAACGIESEIYKNDRLIEDLGELYSGRTEILVDDPSILQQLAGKRTLDISLAASPDLLESLNPNHCCVLRLRDNGKTQLALYKKAKNQFVWVRKPTLRDINSENPDILPANAEQAFAYALLNDPEIRLVTLAGKAGTGKTLMALLSGYEQVMSGIYDKMIVYRPNIPVGDTLGFKKGTIEEKFRPHTQPIIDNLEEILRPRTEQQSGDKKHMRTSHKDLTANDWLEISPIEDVRGRSINASYIIIDETQNLTPHVVKTLVTRTGRGSKVILNGDPSQIDRPYIDSVSNGLVYLIERFKGQEIFGHVTLVKGERSELAELAANLL